MSATHNAKLILAYEADDSVIQMVFGTSPAAWDYEPQDILDVWNADQIFPDLEVLDVIGVANNRAIGIEVATTEMGGAELDLRILSECSVWSDNMFDVFGFAPKLILTHVES